PKPTPKAPAPPKVHPGPKVQRALWMKKVSQPGPAAAKSYVPVLKPVFASQKLPGELVWIAEVESGFDPRARSPVGATGLYQLMPDT
ncbi:lytic transglycosylase domain-containing protein, partial [Citrobacter sp. AAK_AS5]